MHIEKFLPSETIYHLIKEFRYATNQKGENRVIVHVIIDDGCYDFIFYKGDKTIFIYGNGHQIEITNGPFTIHQMKPPYRLNIEGEFKIFVVKVQPWTNSIFFSVTRQKGLIYLDDFYGEKITKITIIFLISQILNLWYIHLNPLFNRTFHLQKLKVMIHSML